MQFQLSWVTTSQRILPDVKIFVPIRLDRAVETNIIPKRSSTAREIGCESRLRRNP